MAAPTQILPPWLSATTEVVDGQTQTSIVYLPLTYFGPSKIPLGSLYTFGGSTSPASIATPTSSATPTSPTSSSTLSLSTSSSITTTSSSLSTSLSISSSLSSSSSSASASASETATPSAAPTASHGLARGQLIGVIVASILGFIFLFVLALCLYLWCNSRRKRRPANGDTRFATAPAPDSEDDESYLIIPAGGISPGEGSPRQSGEEADPFLHRDNRQMQQTPGAGPSTAAAATAANGSPDNSLGSSSKSSGTNSGYGTLLQNPSLGVFVPRFDEAERHTGHILSPEELREEFNALPPELVPRSRLSTVGEQGELPGLTPPPRLVDASRSQTRLSRMPSAGSQGSDPGEVTLLTAQRVRAADLAPRSMPLAPGAESSRRRDSGAWRGLTLGGGLAALGRMSWLQNLTGGASSSRRNSQQMQATALADHDIEAGRALLNADPGTPPDMAELQGPRFRGQLGVAAYTGSRPISDATNGSGNSRSTIYHDAHSSLPGTPRLMPPPRALANSSSAELGYWPQEALTATGSTSTSAHRSRSQENTRQTGTQSTSATTAVDDILDMPIPPSQFASPSSVREVGTSSSQGSSVKAEFPYPPGLTTFATPEVWNETAGTTPSPGSFGGTTVLPPSSNGSDHDDSGISIGVDFLEEEPPSPGDSWRSLAGGMIGTAGTRRTTFGQPEFINPPAFISEQGSLHSMRSHLSPSPHSIGSASASRRDQSGSSGSASSRPSAIARSVVSHGSDGSSLAHSGSVSSDGRKKNILQNQPLSPTLSAFGHIGSPSGSHSGHSQYPSSSIGSPHSHSSSHPHEDDEAHKLAIPPLPSVPPQAVVGDSSQATSRSHPAPQSPPHSPRSPLLSTVPWAGGLDDAWSPS